MERVSRFGKRCGRAMKQSFEGADVPAGKRAAVNTWRTPCDRVGQDDAVELLVEAEADLVLPEMRADLAWIGPVTDWR